MALEDFFKHTCDIYHIQKTDTSLGFGLPSSPAFSYSEEPDLAAVRCHFGVKSETMNIIQLTPQTNYEAKIKLTLPLGTDIRLHDKVINLETGYEYTAEIPRIIRDHHVFVNLQRKNAQEAL